MMNFLTLFLGLCLGVRSVEVAVGEPVAGVEIHLDGQVVGTLRHGPWSLAVDFGNELAPHHLEAVALDPEGREVDRVDQWVNLPRAPAAAVITLEEADGGSWVARLSWQSVVGAEPLAVRLEMDGQPLPVPDPRRVSLPPVDPRRLHFLRAELDFPDRVTVSAEATFGGIFEEAIRADLTAVPVTLEGGGGLPAVEELGGTFLKGARALPVAAVEEGVIDLVVVPAPGAQSAALELSLLWDQARASNRFVGSLSRTGSDPRRTALPLKKQDRVRFLWPFAEKRQGVGMGFDVFTPSQELTAAEGGLLWLLIGVRPGHPTVAAPRLADAVATAGAAAAQRNRRRAVVLVLDGAVEDASQLDPGRVRRYLERLRVPLYVWSLDRGLDAGAWGEVVDASTPVRLERAWKSLSRDLERQRVIWLAGTHLPQEIRLAPDTRRLSFAGMPAGADAFPWQGGAAPLPPPRGQRVGRAGAAAEPWGDPPQDLDLARVVEALAREEPGRGGTWFEVGTTPEPPRMEGGVDPSMLQQRLDRARKILGAEVASLGPYALLTDVDDPALLMELEHRVASLDEVYRRRYGLEPRQPDMREVVLLFAREPAYRRYEQGEETIADLGLEGHAGGGLVALPVEDRTRDEVAALLVHELTHLLNRRALGEDLPPWLDEGVADDLTFSRFDRDGRLLPGTLGGRKTVTEHRRRAVGGGVRIERERELTGALAALGTLAKAADAGEWVPLEELVELSWVAFVAPQGRRLRYPESAFLVRYLLDGERSERFRAFLGAVAEGGRADGEALLGHLGTGWSELQQGFETWLRRLAQHEDLE